MTAAAIANAVAKVGVIDTRAKAGVPFDNQIQEGINEPNISGGDPGADRHRSRRSSTVIEELDVTTGDLCQDTDQFECPD